MSDWYLGAINVYRLGTGVAVTHPLGSLLIDCGDGAAAQWSQCGLGELGPDAILFTSGAAGRISGVYGFLSAFRGIQRNEPLSIVHLLGEELLPNLLEAWQQNEGRKPGPPVHLEGVRPGTDIEVGPFLCRSIMMNSDPIEAVWRISIGDKVVAITGDTAPGQRLSHATRGAHLIVTANGVSNLSIEVC
jgi:ribonuclease BN (tRNA processing enzyme)